MATSSSSAAPSMVLGLRQREHQVFINFRGELRNGFISHLETALVNGEINYYIDEEETPSEKLEVLYTRIDQSDIAIAVFSKGYSKSKWCLKELAKIMENEKAKKIRVIPVFFDVSIYDVKHQEGDFGKNFRRKHGNETTDTIEAWKEALHSASRRIALVLENFRSESDLIAKIVASVKDVIAIIDGEGEGTNTLSRNISSLSSSGNASSRDINEPEAALPCWYGRQQCLKQLEDKFDFDCEETQIVGIVGMPGIGKTTLAKQHLQTWRHKFVSNDNEIFEGFRGKSNDYNWVKNKLLNAQLNEMKVLIVLDDVSDKKHLKFLRMDDPKKTIKVGSKIMITTRDKGSLEGLDHDTYVVPGLNDKEALELFTYYAFTDHTPTEKFVEMSKKFVDYAGGNPRALEELGKEICGKNEDEWQKRLKTLPHCSNDNIRREFRISYDELTEQQKHAFLDIACFFRSEEEDYLRVLLDSYDSKSGEDAREIRDLADKFLISISAGRIEMHNLLCTMGKEIGSSAENNLGKRLWNHQDAVDALVIEKGTNSTRGIFLDTSKIPIGIAVGLKAFIGMRNLRYVKIFDSRCPRQCEIVDCKVNLPDKLKFPLEEIRYLHWLKFPLEELPSDFNPENLIDLRLPYSKIQRVWSEIKDTPNLKWVDLSHSTKLINLSALSNAKSLRRLNLEGCTVLAMLPGDMENMKNLAFLNLKGCTSLSSLPRMKNLTSLKTLILSDCSNLKKFQVISENLEYLHLDGTAIEGLPSTIQNLGRLVVLNLKNCKNLKFLPGCLDKLKALEELILSGCSKLTSFPDVKEIMENLQILLLDGTLIEDMPDILLLQRGNNSIDLQRKQPQTNRLSLLRRLCLSGNEKISRLHISQLYHLQRIDLKNCRNLESLSTLPANLQCLDAHDCVSLKTVGSPLALLLPLTEQVPSSFIFTNCQKLEHTAKNEIICYAHNKSRLISDALNRHNKGLALEALVSTCFPGSEVPTWFKHKASGAVLKPELPGHWSENGFVAIALCAIVSFQDYQVPNNNLMVKCYCEFNNSSSFDCNVGIFSKVDDEQAKSTVNSTHVFISYTSWLNMKDFHEGDNKGCVDLTKASIRFEVLDGTSEAVKCEVLKCGFSLVCESDNGSWDANVDASPVVSESDHTSSDANFDASPVVSESDRSSSDANIDTNPMAEEEEARPSVCKFLGHFRRRGWFSTG